MNKEQMFIRTVSIYKGGKRIGKILINAEYCIKDFLQEKHLPCEWYRNNKPGLLKIAKCQNDIFLFFNVMRSDKDLSIWRA
jgi:hypothetical protein